MPCVVSRAHTAQRLSSPGPDSNPQRTSVTQVCAHAAAVLVYRANTVAVTCSYRPAAAGHPNSTRGGSSTGHVYELGGVDGCQHLPSLSSSLSSLYQSAAHS